MALLVATARASAAGRRRRWFRFALALLAATQLAGQPEASREYQVKAVFLFNFTQFTDWPALVFDRPDAPLVVGILGTDHFGRALDEAMFGESAGTHPIVVRRYADIDEAGACQVLFISGSESSRFERIFDRLRGRPVLTVSDAEGFAVRGGMIRFVTEKGRIRLRVNLDAVREAGLQISSKLLRHAEIVGKKDTP